MQALYGRLVAPGGYAGQSALGPFGGRSCRTPWRGRRSRRRGCVRRATAPGRLRAWACRGLLPGCRTPRGLEVGPGSVPPQTLRPPVCLCRCGVLEPWMERCLCDLRSVPRGRAVGGGPAACLAPGVGPSGPVPGWPVSGASLLSHAAMSGGRSAGVRACWLPGWPVTLLGISALGGPRAFRSAIGTGASFRCGRPSASPVAPAPVSTVGSSRCGWAGGANGTAASSFTGVAAWVWPSGTGAGLGWLPVWPPSVHVLPIASAAAGRAAGVPPSRCGTPVGSPWPGVFARGVSVGTEACAGSGSGSGLGAGGLPDGAYVGRTAGSAGGSWR